jgi:hypothetical protein
MVGVLMRVVFSEILKNERYCIRFLKCSHHLFAKCMWVIALLFCIYSCKNNLQTSTSSASVDTTMKLEVLNPELKKLITEPDEDPYFVRSSDTISVEGPKSICRSIYQDSKGNYWFATWQGIIQYDSKVFTNYTLKFGLKKFHMFSVFEDSKGNIWFGSIGSGVYKFDGKTFVLYTVKEGLSGTFVTSIAEDQEGNI